MTYRILVATAATICVGLNGIAAEIDLSKPVSESITEITGIYWNFDELAGPQQWSLDASGQGNNGVPLAGNGDFPSLVTGVDRPGTSGFGKAVRLGTSEAAPGEEGNPRIIVNMPVENSLAMVDTSFTGGIWVRFSTIKYGENQTVLLMDKGGFNTKAGANAGHFCLFLTKDRSDAWRIGFQVGDGDENATVFADVSGGWNLHDGQWHHIGFNFKHNPPDGNLVSFWLNGEEIGSENVLLSLTSGSSNTGTRRFFVGERVTTNYNSTFDGAVDDVFVTEGYFTFKPIPQP